MTKMLTTVPFSGFYESVHSSNLDQAENYMTQDESGEPMFCLFDYVNIRYGEVFLKYAQAYVESLSAEYDIPLEFESMNSPREYNFTTDRIFAEIDLARAYLMLRQTREDESLDGYARQCFTSRSGFSSFYDPDWKTWGPLRDWDHNQVGTLLAAFLDTDGDTFREWEVYSSMEYEDGNGVFESWLWNAMPAAESKRVGKVLGYLRERSERAWRTIAEQRTANLPFSALPLGAL